MTLELQQVARAMHAEGEAPAIPVAGWSVDTRTQNVGDVYFALRGPNHDGHVFVAEAWRKGAALSWAASREARSAFCSSDTNSYK